MGRGLLLWLIGIPIPVILLLWLFFMGEPIWGAVAIAALWFTFVFWKV